MKVRLFEDQRTEAERVAGEATVKVRRLEAEQPMRLGAVRKAIRLRERAWREVNRLRGTQ